MKGKAMKGNKLVIGVLTMFLVLLITENVKSQDPNFSQYFNNPVYYNPALIGADVGMKIRFQYRDQWSNLPGDFKTLNFNMDMAERNIPGSGGLGLMFNRKQEGQGFLEKTMAGLGTSVRVRLQENIVSQLGFMGTFVDKHLNYDNLVFSDEFDERYGKIYSTSFVPPQGGNGQVTYPDLVVGNIIRFFPSAYSVDKVVGTIGAAVHHTLTPDDSYLGVESNVPRKYVAHGNILWIDQRSSSGRNRENSFSGLTKYDFGFLFESWQKRSNYSIGLNVMRSSVYFGAWYQGESYGDFRSDNMVFMLGLNYGIAENARMKIMYSYDWALNDLISVSGPTHEISLILQMDDVMLFGKSDSYRRAGYSGSSGGRSSGGIIKKPLECSSF